MIFLLSGNIFDTSNGKNRFNRVHDVAKQVRVMEVSALKKHLVCIDVTVTSVTISVSRCVDLLEGMYERGAFFVSLGSPVR